MAFTDPNQITNEEIKSHINSCLNGLYEYLIDKGINVKDYSLQHWKTHDDNHYYNISYGYLIDQLDKKGILIFVEIKSGKYKGSIGHISNTTYDNKSKIQVSDSYVDTTTPLSAKAMKLLVDHDGTYCKRVKQREIRDIFDQTIEPNDKVIFAEKGKLRIGVLQEYDFHKNIAHIRTPEGKCEVNPRKSDIVNCQKINETFISNSVLTAMLKS